MAGQTIDTEELIDLAERLRDLGVTEFTVGEVSVKFGGPVATKVTVEPYSAGERAPDPKPRNILEAAERIWGPVKFGGQK